MVSTSKAKQKNSRCLQQTTDALVTLLMASCGEVDHSASSLASNRKGGGESRPDSGCPSTSLPVPECAICLQSCVHPVCLPCTHVFCFLCVKGASWQSKRCALCRQEIPEDFLERPTLLSPEELKASASGRGEGEHAWYYEGRNGWWQYDERTNRELEDAFTKGKKSTEMLIAGFLYVADLENMVQYRRNEHGRRRRMKRDVVDIPKKGVAGLRLDADAVSQAALRENSADGADTSGAQPAGPGAGTSPASVSSTPSSPPSQSSAQSPSLESAFAQLRVSPPTAEERGPAGEGEEADGEESLSPPGSSAQVTSVEESGSSGDEDGVEGDDPDEPRQPGPDPDGRPPHMGQSFSGAGGARRPDGQSTVTEV